MEFKKGMQVKCIRDILDCNTKNKIGKIVCIDKYDSISPYGVEFDKFMDTCTSCWGYGKSGYCLWVNGKDIIPYNLKQRIK